MKTFKYFDAYVQVILIVAAVLHGLKGLGRYFDFQFADQFTGYFVVGGYQVLSCLINLFFIKSKFKTVSRKSYEKTLLVVLGLAVISVPIGAAIFVFFSLLIVGPVMAIFYYLICFSELKLLNHEKE